MLTVLASREDLFTDAWQRHDDKSRCSFTLDVSADDFERLLNLSLEGVVSLAHRYLLSFPPLELDPA
jgi:hypothetical protein